MKRSQRKLCACRNYRSDLRGVLEGGTEGEGGLARLNDRLDEEWETGAEGDL